MKVLFLMLLFTLVSCSSHRDAAKAESVAYMCDGGQKIIADYSFSFERVALRLDKQRIELHHYIYERGEGYQSSNYLWQVEGKNGKLISKNNVGSRKVIFKQCIALKNSDDFDPLAQTHIVRN